MDEKPPNFFKKKAEDLLAALMIIAAEGIIAVAILAVGNAVAWCIKMLAPDEALLVTVVRYIVDGGSVGFFVIFVLKDMWEYLRKR
jgi:hypothetical protein